MKRGDFSQRTTLHKPFTEASVGALYMTHTSVKDIGSTILSSRPRLKFKQPSCLLIVKTIGDVSKNEAN